MNTAQRERLEILIGASVAAVLILVVAFVFSPARPGDDSYTITAAFSQTDGLSPGSTVYAAGVPVGKLEGITLDDNFRAIATLRIDRAIVFDSDTSAAIVTDGLFGGKFIQVEVGGGEFDISPGGSIDRTESSLVLDDLLELIISRARANAVSQAPAPVSVQEREQ